MAKYGHGILGTTEGFDVIALAPEYSKSGTLRLIYTSPNSKL